MSLQLFHVQILCLCRDNFHSSACKETIQPHGYVHYVQVAIYLAAISNVELHIILR